MARAHHHWNLGRFTDPWIRFQRKVVLYGDCQVFTGQLDKDGYGCYSPHAYGVKVRYERAHRYAWRILRGPLTKGLELDHLCQNKACVNVEHLEEVTHRVNVHRSDNAAGRNARKTHCHMGHPLSGDNLFIDTKGGRVCRICSRERARRYWRERSQYPCI